jgi:phosphohistidine phosphatase
MKLYLVQHAKAASEQQDPQRSLTEEGKRDIEKIAAFIKPLNLTVDILWHSGKKRAAQTAQFLADAINVRQGPIARDGLAPNDDVTVLRDEVSAVQQDIMIVGHLPFLDKLASLLLTASQSAATVSFKNAGLICLYRSEDNHWRIDWMITPQLLI